MKKRILILLALAILVIACAWVFFPSPSREYVFQCAELSPSGEVIGHCELSFTAAIREHPGKCDQFHLQSIEIPGESILDTFPALSIREAEDYWWVSLPAADQTTARTYTLDIAISNDGSFCLIRYCNRRFVGSVDTELAPAEMLPLFAGLLEDFFTYRDPFS